uniref:hypothetical protein n=1 Tax=uncultured Fretibacterium sp. TaxID=1678694 RepID=UPI0026278D65
ETDEASKEKLAALVAEKEELHAEEAKLQAKWESETQAILRVRAISKAAAVAWYQSREALGFPLCKQGETA